jgi:CheY-like chemotaxis protein
MIESAVEICRSDLDAEAQDLEVVLAAGLYHVAGDAARLQQVLWNVLKNAIKFTGRGGRITIRTSNPSPETIRVAIQDSGRGIEAAALERIFGAFEQGQPQIIARYGGLGLGLAISKMFVERHAGTISARSEGLGKGAEFVIDLPITTVEHGPGAHLESAPSSVPANATILLIEDHADTLAALARLLERKGHTVVGAKDGASARRAFAKGDFDVIISDLGLPDCTGLDLMREFRFQRATPAIALSGYGMEADVRDCIAAGFNNHLTKPIDFGELLSAVSRLVTKH